MVATRIAEDGSVMTQQIPDVLCYGVQCFRHYHCLRYTAGDGAVNHERWIGECGSAGDRPMFIPIEVESARA